MGMVSVLDHVLLLLLLLLLLASLFLPPGALAADNGAAVDIGSRWELFVDGFLVEKLDGTTRKLHATANMPRAKSLLPDRFYCTILKDGDLFRAYWRGKDASYPRAVECFNEHPEELPDYPPRLKGTSKNLVTEDCSHFSGWQGARKEWSGLHD